MDNICQTICKQDFLETKKCKIQLLEERLKDRTVDDIDSELKYFSHVNPEKVLKERTVEDIVSAINVFLEISLKPCCSDELMHIYFNKLIDKIVWINKHWCAIRLLKKIIDEFGWCFEGTYELSVLTRDFLKKILNHPKVVESFISASLVKAKRFYYVLVVDKINKLFVDEAALEILRRTRKKKIFYIFGYHSVISKHIDLQYKWLHCFTKEKIYSRSGFQNITDKVLETAPLDDAMYFISKAFVRLSLKDDLHYVMHFDLAVIKKIIMTHILVYGKNEFNMLCLQEIKNLLKNIKNLEEKK